MKSYLIYHEQVWTQTLAELAFGAILRPLPLRAGRELSMAMLKRMAAVSKGKPLDQPRCSQSPVKALELIG
jgi:hypothetical protein